MKSVKVKKIKRILRIPFEWLGIGLGFAAFAFLPRRAMLGVCDAVSALFCFFDRRGRRQALYNLRAVRGDASLPASFKDLAHAPTAREKRVIRRSYRTAARAVGHAFWTSRCARERVAAAGEMDARTRAFLAEHRPAVTVSAHMGCWEILSQLAFLEGHRMMSVAKSVGTDAMTRLLMKARTSIGQEIVPAAGAFRPLLAGMKRGASLGLLVDQVVKPSEGGAWVLFFGRPVPVSVAPAFFASRCGAPIVVAWSRPLRDGRYRCTFVSSYTPEEARDVWGTTQRCIDDLARVIRRHPSCWLLAYNTFRRRISPEERAELDARARALGERRCAR
jgi:lauroyl/myristoyl acyltransferase